MSRFPIQLVLATLAVGCATLGDRVNGQSGGSGTEAATPVNRDDVPIVLLHGMAGFGEVHGYEYFYKVPDALTADGRRIFATEVDPFNTVAHRAEQLSPQIDEILAKTGAPQVDIIAHSQGGLDARYLVTELGYGDRVRTVVTVSTPHRGTLIADATLGWVPDMPTEAAAAFNFVDWLGAHATGTDVDLQAQVWGMSRRYVEGTFNPSTPDDPRVRYYSYAGSTQASPFVDRDTVDIVNPGLFASYVVLKTLEGENDGLVSVKSAPWGSFLGVLPADHFDEVGQPFGALSPSFDHIAFYRALARFLAGQGPAPTY